MGKLRIDVTTLIPAFKISAEYFFSTLLNKNKMFLKTFFHGYSKILYKNANFLMAVSNFMKNV